MPSPLRLRHVAIPAPDIAASAAFYTLLGGQPGFVRHDAGRVTLLQLHFGDGFVELLADAGSPGGGHFAFSTDDIEQVWSLLERHGHRPAARPRRGASGVQWFFVSDPAGNAVEITMLDPHP
jgi:catechol 2,3-dioxygenase-like lactoylglutathione lyase family enzyme